MLAALLERLELSCNTKQVEFEWLAPSNSYLVGVTSHEKEHGEMHPMHTTFTDSSL